MGTILVIDDDVVVRTTLKYILEEEGFEVLLASDGCEGLELLERGQQVDLVITDMVMPQVTGLEVLMHARNRYPHLPIMAMSSGGFSAKQDLLPLARFLGAASTFTKPVDRRELLAAVGDLVASH